ncbi:MAG: hypothetical protein M4579_000471 [Chaenotheca gracillima]|nr:MAG: hypothetical protein M4579_000471 [Chaenotheca gracillima]
MTSRANNAAPRNNNRSAAPASYNHAGVRRNLFNGHHLRRPGPSSTASTSATTLQAPSTTDQDNATASSNTNSADIVVRDKNGNYEVEVPLVPIEKQEDVLERERLPVSPLVREPWKTSKAQKTPEWD